MLELVPCDCGHQAARTTKLYMNITCLIKLIFATVNLCNFVISEFNPIIEVQGIGNWGLPNALFQITHFQRFFLNGGYRCLWAVM